MIFKNIRQYVESKRDTSSNFWFTILFLKDELREKINDRYYMESLILKNHKAICFFIPKTASSSLRSAFYKLIKGKELERFEDVYTLPKVKKKNFSKYKNYFKFTIMRNPYERLLSCYYDFIIDRRRRNIFPTYKNISFKAFVKDACSYSDEHTNIHLKSQHTFITDKDGNLLVDYIGRFEDLGNEYNKIMEIMKIKNIPKLSHIKKSSKKKNRFYNERIRAMVKKRYKRDFEIYNKLK